VRPSVDIDGRSQLCSVHATRLRGGTPEEQLLAISDVFHDFERSPQAAAANK
jgi:hypothetical protein